MISSGQVALLDEYDQSTDFGPFDTAVLITLVVYSALSSAGPPPVAGTNSATMQLFKGEQGREQVMPEIDVGPPGVYQYANARGFRMRNQVAGQQAYYQAQAWFPNEPIALTQVGSAQTTINPSGGMIPIPCCGGGGGGSVLDVTDGSIDVNPTTQIFIGQGLVLTNPSPGVAQIDNYAVLFNDDNEELPARSLRVVTNDETSLTGYGMVLINDGNNRTLLEVLQQGGLEVTLPDHDNAGIVVDIHGNDNAGMLTAIAGTNNSGWSLDVSGTGNNGVVIRARAAAQGGVLIQTLATEKIGVFGKTPVVQQATPVTLGNVISLLQAYGWAA